MENFVLFIGHVWLLAGLVLIAHYYSPRFGFAPLLFVISGLTVLLQGQPSIFIEPSSGLLLLLKSNILVPIILMSVLIIYIANGSVPARMTIFGVLGLSVLVVVILVIYRLHLTLPGGGSFTGLRPEDLVPLTNARTTAASLIAFAADMFIIAVFYQGVKNYAPTLPEWLVVGLALIVGLWVDSIIYYLIGYLGTVDFLAIMPNDVLGKTVSAILIWPLLAAYMTNIAPAMPEHVGAANRPIFDLLFGSFEDVKMTLVRTQAALQTSEAERRKEAAYFREISDHITEALWLASPGQKHAFFVNPAYQQIWGRSAAEIYADPDVFVNSLHPEDRDRVLAEIEKQETGAYDVEYRVVRPDGTIRWVRDRAFPIFNEKGEFYRIAGIAEDITERKQMERQTLELAIERERVKVLRDFIGEASHDLKAPLTAINLKIYHLRRAQDPERFQKHLDELGEISTRMNKLIDDLLTLARLDNMITKVDAQVDIHSAIREILGHIRLQADEKRVALQTDLCESSPVIQANVEDILRALTNLIENAVRYTPSGGLVNVQTRIHAHEVIIQVSDTGIGIPDDEINRVFERFYRASNARAAETSGTGLGLIIVKKIIEQHGGTVEVKSAVNQGTTFTVRIPIIPTTTMSPV